MATTEAAASPPARAPRASKSEHRWVHGTLPSFPALDGHTFGSYVSLLNDQCPGMLPDKAVETFREGRATWDDMRSVLRKMQQCVTKATCVL